MARDAVELSAQTISVMTQGVICESSLSEFGSGHAVSPFEQGSSLELVA